MAAGNAETCSCTLSHQATLQPFLSFATAAAAAATVVAVVAVAAAAAPDSKAGAEESRREREVGLEFLCQEKRSPTAISRTPLSSSHLHLLLPSSSSFLTHKHSNADDREREDSPALLMHPPVFFLSVLYT